MNRTSAQDLRAAFTRCTSAASAAGLDTTGWTLAEGSATYGRAFRLHKRDADHGGLTSLIPGDGFLGMTRRDAVLSLDGMTAAFHLLTR